MVAGGVVLIQRATKKNPISPPEQIDYQPEIERLNDNILILEKRIDYLAGILHGP